MKSILPHQKYIDFHKMNYLLKFQLFMISFIRDMINLILLRMYE